MNLIIGILLGALVAASQQEVETRPLSLEQLVRTCDAVVVGTVVAVHRVPQSPPIRGERFWRTIPIAELSVERMIFGAPDTHKIFAVAARVENGALVDSLVEGERALVFLEPDRMFRSTSETTKKALVDATRGQRLFVPSIGGRWRISADRDWIGLPNPTVMMPDALTLKDGKFRAAEVIAWVDARLDAVTPTVRGRHATTGPSPWGVVVEADGTWQATSGSGKLPSASFKSLWRRIEEAQLAIPLEGFGSSVKAVGRAAAPDTSFRFIEVRTRRGVARYGIHSEHDTDTVTTRARRAQMLHIWDGLPGENKP